MILHKLHKNQKKVFKAILENKNRYLPLLQDAHDEAFEKIHCLDCANCCKNHSPRFKLPDIRRIARHLKMKEGDFISTYLFLDDENDYVLKRQPCYFLNDDHTCRIYDVRPSDCVRYPYTNEDTFLKRKHITLKNAEVCPAVYYILEKFSKDLG